MLITGKLPNRSRDGERLRVTSESSTDSKGWLPVLLGPRRFMTGLDPGLESGVAKGLGLGDWVGV